MLSHSSSSRSSPAVAARGTGAGAAAIGPGSRGVPVSSGMFFARPSSSQPRNALPSLMAHQSPEFMTPLRIAILIAILASSVKYLGSDDHADPHDNAALLTVLMDAVKNHYINDRDFRDFANTLEKVGVAGVALKSTVVEKIRAIRSLDDLCNIFADAKTLLPREDTPGVLEKHSELGVFVDKMIQDYDRMSFEELCKFYDATRLSIVKSVDEQDLSNQFLCTDVESTRMKRHIDEMDTDEVEAKVDGVTSEVNQIHISHYDAAEYLDFVFLEKNARVIPPEVLRENIRKIHRQIPDMIRVHYISFLTGLRTGDFENARDSLHRFFDLLSSGPARPIGFQYALLDLGVLHATFNHRDMALTALEECITLSREAKDNDCLEYAKAWRDSMRLESRSQIHALPAIDRRIQSSRNPQQPEFNAAYLQCLSEINKARLAFETARPPKEVFAILYRAAMIRVKLRVKGCASLINSLYARVWTAYGNDVVAYTYAHLHQRPDHSVGDDEELSAIQISEHAIKEAAAGNDALAVELIQKARSLFPMHNIHDSIHWIRASGLILLRRSLNRGDVFASHILLNQMEPMCEEDKELTIEVRRMRARHYVLVGRPMDALEILYALVKENRGPESQCANTAVSIPLDIVEIFLNHADLMTGKAMERTCATLSLAKKHSLTQTRNVASFHMSRILLKMHLPFQALKTALGVLPSTLTSADKFVVASGRVWFVECAIVALARVRRREIADNAGEFFDRGDLSLEPATLEECEERWGISYDRVFRHLDSAFKEFASVDAIVKMREVLHIKATVLHDLGREAERDECAKEFLRLEFIEYPSHENGDLFEFLTEGLTSLDRIGGVNVL